MKNRKKFNTTSESRREESSKINFKRRTLLKGLTAFSFLGLFPYQALSHVLDNFGKEGQHRILERLGMHPRITQAEELQSFHQTRERIRIGFIGFGSRGGALARGLGFLHPLKADLMKKNEDLQIWMKQENLNVELAGICDVFDLHAEIGMETAKKGLRINGDKGTNYPIKRYRTYKELLKDKDIDAVMIATPDHHHARISIDAIKAGKHVYCEKSISLSEKDLFEVYHSVKNSDRIFQLGHQINQNVVFQQAKKVIEKNFLGEITLVETTTNRNSANGAWIRHLDANGEPKPGNLDIIDWEQWLGNAPKVPFSIDRFYNWTKFFDYNTGMLGQLFTHEFDAINQLLNIGIPKSVVAVGGIYYWKDNREMPDVLNCIFDYPDKGLTLTYNATLANSFPRPRLIMGKDASMELGKTMRITIDKNSTRHADLIKEYFSDIANPVLTVTPDYQVDAVSGATSTENYFEERGLTNTVINGEQIDTTHLHIKEWLNCIRNGGTPSANIEKAFEEGITVLMAHKSYLENRKVEWDPVKRRIV